MMNNTLDGTGHEGPSPEDMAMKNGADGPPPTQLPKCFCNWRFCRTYQKAFREFKHPFYNGVIKLKFYENDPRSMALKESIDRTLNVEATKRNDWKEAASNGAPGCIPVTSTNTYCRYYVARHHFTEKLMKHYLNDRRSWDWNEPLRQDEAEDFLYSLDPQDIYDDDDGQGNGETCYVQTPNVPKDFVRELLKRLKDMRSSGHQENGIDQMRASAHMSTPPSNKRVSLASQDECAPPSTHSRFSSGQPTSQPKTQKRNNNSSNSTHRTAKSAITKASNDEMIVIESEDYDDSDEEEYNNDSNYKSNANRKQLKDEEVSSTASSTVALLAQKEEENHRLREDLNDCKQQISMLQNVVAKLQVRLDLDDTEGDAAESGRASVENSAGKKKRDNNKNAKPGRRSTSRKERTPSFSSADDEDDGQEAEDSSEEGTSALSYPYRDNTVGTREYTGSIRQNHQSLRRTSIHSRRSLHGGSIAGGSRRPFRRGSMRGGGDDGASVMSRQSLQSISVSIKSLPREIELMDDEDDEDDIRGKDDSSYFHDTGSVGSRSAASRGSRKSFVRIRRKPRPGNKPASNKQRQRRPGGVPPEIDVSGDELDNIDVTHENVSTDTLFVKEKQIVDPYGEKGVYTGALSKSTCMPNGKGRLEYEKESRWYEGDWIHGRWTGFGRLSNGDGDFYQGGLKNDHKHGTGIMRFADGRVFEGEYIRGQMIQGQMTYQDGSIYGGSWVDGMRHGRGKCIFVDGSQYEGEFREGNFHGHGKMTWNDGGWYVGNWSNGEMDGRGKEVRPDGSLRHDGEWSAGQPVRSATDTRRRRQQQLPVGNGDELS